VAIQLKVEEMSAFHNISSTVIRCPAWNDCHARSGQHHSSLTIQLHRPHLTRSIFSILSGSMQRSSSVTEQTLSQTTANSDGGLGFSLSHSIPEAGICCATFSASSSSHNKCPRRHEDRKFLHADRTHPWLGCRTSPQQHRDRYRIHGSFQGCKSCAR
jgi:hypothetical protein